MKAFYAYCVYYVECEHGFEHQWHHATPCLDVGRPCTVWWVIEHENQNINMERLTFMKNGIRKWVITFFFLYENFSLSPLALENRKNVLFYEKNQYNAYKLKFIKGILEIWYLIRLKLFSSFDLSPISAL